jgi:hypothetical protein
MHERLVAVICGEPFFVWKQRFTVDLKQVTISAIQMGHLPQVISRTYVAEFKSRRQF